MDGKRQSRLQDLGITPWVPRHPSKPRAAVQAPAAATSPAAPVVVHSQEQLDGRAAAVAAMDWAALKAAVKSCTACGLRVGCTQTVFGVGDERAKWLFIGEAPGADEDKQGEPFVGRAGQLLNSMIAALGLKREDVYIANILKCRPPNNRDPAPSEAELCRPFLERQIALIQPRLIVALGRIAAQNLLNTETPIGKLRGAVHRLGSLPVVVTYHPAYLLRSPGEKRKAWVDLQLAMRSFRETGG
ncbi:MAG: uracil-DNA glycosylase [Bacillota bacterium]